MNFDSMGAWLPVWIIGAPFVLAIIDWMLTPKGSHASSTPARDERPHMRPSG